MHKGNRKAAGFRRLSDHRAFAAAAAVVATAPFFAIMPASAAPASAATAAVAGPVTLRSVVAAPRIPVGAHVLAATNARAAISGAVALRPRDNSALQSFIAGVTSPKSKFFHHYLAPGEFGKVFGPTAATVAAVEHTLSASGLHVSGVSSDGLLVSFTGTVRAAESAFHTTIESLRLPDGSIGRATTSAVRLPSTISASVAGVVGLDDLTHYSSAEPVRGPLKNRPSFPAAKAGHVKPTAVGPAACSDATAAAQLYGGLTDDQIPTPTGPRASTRRGDDGAGQTIAVFELEPFLPSDVRRSTPATSARPRQEPWPGA